MSKINVLVLHIHGLFRGRNLELGRDADTGGQTKYVLEYAKELAKNPKIGEVYIFTRKLKDKDISEDYNQEIEPISENLKIIRIRCAKSKYLKKEKLWKYLDEFIENSKKYIDKHKIKIDLIHSHYADGGYIAIALSQSLKIPFIHTGHSLGRSKKVKLLEQGLSEQKINKTYNMKKRIEAEEDIIERASAIIVSTEEEIEKQYGLYKNKDKGRYYILAPGVELEKFFPYYYLENIDIVSKEEYELCFQARTKIKNELSRFMLAPDKPLILAICRPEARKNIEGLIQAYGEDRELQHIANLAIFAGIRKDISDKDEQEKQILTDMLLLMDKYDLYGKLAIPKKHNIEYEVPELYRYAASLKGIFVNPAFIEPFGLTLIEAAASGLPIVATDNGGPKDIIKYCKNGILVNVQNSKNISKAIKKIIINNDLWLKFSNNGIINSKKYYSWKNYCDKLINIIFKNRIIKIKDHTEIPNNFSNKITGKKSLIITDIDNTLIGNKEYLKEFLKWLNKRKKNIGFGIATGRSIESTLHILQFNKVRVPDILITSVGTEIYYYFRNRIIMDKEYENYINTNWQPSLIKMLLEALDFLRLQLDLRKYKVSYFIDNADNAKIRIINNILRENNIKYNLIFTEGRLIDILPARASKYDAIAFVIKKWGIKEDNLLVCGDSGNDMEMLLGFKNSVVVANHQKELDGLENVYYSKYSYAKAILDGMKKFKIKG